MFIRSKLGSIPRMRSFKDIKRLRQQAKRNLGPNDACRIGDAQDAHKYGKILRKNLINSFVCGKMPANSICELAWYITKAGGKGVEDLAYDPNTKCFRKNAAKYLQKSLGMHEIGNVCLLRITVPLRTRGMKSAREPVVVMPVYEVMSRYFTRNRFMPHVQNAALLCPNFYEHPAVIKHGPQNCFPLRLFVDYAKLDNRQSVLNITIAAVFDKRKIPVISLHNRLICKCGCRGNHTTQVLMDHVAWLGQIFESGKWPAENYYGLKWDAASFRSQNA